MNPGAERIDLRIDGVLEQTVRLGLVEVSPVSVGPSAPSLLKEIDAHCAGLKVRWSGRQPSEIAQLRPARELYRAFGIDPTKTRPSSEALLRRILKGKPFPRVLNAVDLCNLLSVTFLLSLGLYDVGKIAGPVVFRRGAAGESYRGIRKERVHLAGRPLLADDRGPFGNPTSDSSRTAVDPGTETLALVVFAPFDYGPTRLAAHVDAAGEAMCRFLSPPEKTANYRLTQLPG